MAWTPGSEWDGTLYKVRVRFELPWGLAVTTTTAPGAATAVVSAGTLGSATIMASPPTMALPFSVVARATKSDTYQDTYTPAHAVAHGVAPAASALVPAPSACGGTGGGWWKFPLAVLGMFYALGL